MSEEYPDVSTEDIEKLYTRLKREAESGGYYLNPDDTFTKDLVRGLIINSKRYGYMACPCRLAEGEKKKDLDIICPCDYRDADITEYGACFCALYVSEEIASGKKSAKPIPDRRERAQQRKPQSASLAGGLSLPVWRCSVCGYLAAREAPPEKCPICKVPRERFQLFIEASGSD